MHNGKYGCALWGCGWVASGHIAAYLKNKDCEFIGLGSRRKESALAKVAEFGLNNITIYNSFEEILSDSRVDVVSICTPNDLHAEEAILAAKAGKQIFLEKPAAVSEEQLDRLTAVISEYKTKTVMGLVLRFNPLSLMQKRLIAEGELGQVLLANVDYWFGRDRGGWMREGKRSGGAFVLGGCHSVDLASFLLGSPISAVRGDALQVGDWYDYPPVETAQVQFANGAKGVFSCSLTGFVPYTANTHIIGEDGTILNDQFYLRRFKEQKEFFKIDTGVKKTGDVYGHPFPQIVDHFISCLKEDRDSEHNVASAVNSHKACFAICRSASGNGEWIKL
ncbi:MAG: Gfo/Idh/MocA family oxidoreductase [Lentisphaerae bacterium]|nr:Gfo/Idh/MocA family oxidoreductase [Lentisphaerota bacterium]